MGKPRRNWAVIMAPWIASRSIGGKPLRDHVWREMAPLRAALSQGGGE